MLSAQVKALTLAGADQDEVGRLLQLSGEAVKGALVKENVESGNVIFDAEDLKSAAGKIRALVSYADNEAVSLKAATFIINQRNLERDRGVSIKDINNAVRNGIQLARLKMQQIREKENAEVIDIGDKAKEAEAQTPAPQAEEKKRI